MVKKFCDQGVISYPPQPTNRGVLILQFPIEPGPGISVPMWTFPKGGYKRTAAQGAELEYSYDGTPVVRGQCFPHKYQWDIETHLSREDLSLLMGLSEAQDNARRKPPRTNYACILDDLILPIIETSPRRRPLADTSNYQHSFGQRTEFYARFQVLVPVNKIEVEFLGNGYKARFSMQELAIPT